MPNPRTARQCATLLAFALLAFASAQAQTKTLLRANVPFEFSIGKQVLASGSYEFRVAPNGRSVMVSGGKAALYAPIITRLGDVSAFREASLVFDFYDERRALAEVWIPGEDGLLLHSTPASHRHEVVYALVSGLSPKLSGKDAFDRTCAKCHGPEGKGNPAANNFFQANIPRLDSDYVQSKSDEEMREIITRGRRMMDPVRIGKPSVQHSLQSESVDSIIAYVRGLKKR
jgi:cytochrome c553